ncbi:MAG: adenosylcobinamide amidohydrolase [Archaeoglobaceae archaeon]|nr:adenosylcobinamide amidohydrolase [Archaeoglobaceae archaeon]MDW8117396.1 adenosylcobinamide amidohydrolase [Archaeoglobaceae archaeon]
MPYNNYYLDENTLIVRGNFFGVSTGLLGGWKKVQSAFNHRVRSEFYKMDPVDYLKLIANSYYLKSYFGLLTAVPMDKLSIRSHGSVTAFVTAGVDNPNEMTINVILILEARVNRSGLLNAIINVTEAKSKALFDLSYRFTGTNTDAVVVLSTMNGKYEKYTGPATDLGRSIWKCVSEGVKESLEKWKI